jgi:hypothetical protein
MRIPSSAPKDDRNSQHSAPSRPGIGDDGLGDGAVTARSRRRSRVVDIGPGSTNGKVPTLPPSAPSNTAEPIARRDGSPQRGNVFACLVHEAPDCVADLVANLQYLDPDSTILLYDGSGGALLGELSRLTAPGVPVHPHPRVMASGKLHDFALDCMRFALERLDFGALTIVDSNQLALRPGYSAYLAASSGRHPLRSHSRPASPMLL